MYVITEMMRLAMLIDSDHMAQKSANRALDIAEAVPGGGYPLNSGHNVMRGLGGGTSENSRTSTQLMRIGNLHGMAGVGSAKLDAYEWLQLYGAVVQAMGND